MKVTTFDSFGSYESIYVHFNTIETANHEVNHFEHSRNIKLTQ